MVVVTSPSQPELLSIPNAHDWCLGGGGVCFWTSLSLFTCVVLRKFETFTLKKEKPFLVRPVFFSGKTQTWFFLFIQSVVTATENQFLPRSLNASFGTLVPDPHRPRRRQKKSRCRLLFSLGPLLVSGPNNKRLSEVTNPLSTRRPSVDSLVNP